MPGLPSTSWRRAFGFEIESVVRNGDDGQVSHAQVQDELTRVERETRGY